MEITITKRLPLEFDQNNNALTFFDFNKLQSEHQEHRIDRHSEIITITESAIYITYKAVPKSKTENGSNQLSTSLPDPSAQFIPDDDKESIYDL